MSVTESTVKPFLKGIFSLYNTPDGGILISYRIEGSDQDEHKQIPAAIVRTAQIASETGVMPSPLKLLKMMRRGNS